MSTNSTTPPLDPLLIPDSLVDQKQTDKAVSVVREVASISKSATKKPGRGRKSEVTLEDAFTYKQDALRITTTSGRSDGNMMPQSKIRGIYEYPRGSGKFWIQYFVNGRRHRESIGPRALAIAVREKRMTELREDRFFPELRRRRVSFDRLCDDFVSHCPNHWSGGMLQTVRAWFAHMPASSVTPRSISEQLNKLVGTGRT
jgi:hypothetical protein